MEANDEEAEANDEEAEATEEEPLLAQGVHHDEQPPRSWGEFCAAISAFAVELTAWGSQPPQQERIEPQDMARLVPARPPPSIRADPFEQWVAIERKVVDSGYAQYGIAWSAAIGACWDLPLPPTVHHLDQLVDDLPQLVKKMDGLLWATECSLSADL
jgi:hypothetical protein